MCDGSGYMIGCPGCALCEDEMEAIRASKKEVAARLAGLTLRYGSPWADDPQEVAK